MKSFRLTLIALALIVGLVVFTIYDSKRASKKDEQTQQNQLVIRFKLEEIKRVELNSAHQVASAQAPLVLEKVDANWRLASPIQDSTDTQAVLTFLSGVLQEKIIYVLGSGDGLNLAKYGLAQTSVGIKVSAGEGGKQQTELKLGSSKAFDANLYGLLTSTGEPPRVVLVGPEWDNFLTKPVKEFRDKRMYRGSEATEFTHVLMRRRDQIGVPELILDKGADGTWKFTKGGSVDSLPVANESVQNLIQQVKALRAVDFNTANASTVTHAAFEIELGGGDSKKPYALRFSPHVENDANVVGMSSDLPTTMNVLNAAKDELKRKPEDFFDKKVPFKFPVGEVAKMRVKSKIWSGEVQKKSGLWMKSGSDPNNPKSKDEIDGVVVDRTLERLSQLQALRILSKDKVKLQDESRIELFKSNGEKLFDVTWGAPVTEKIPAQKAKSRNPKLPAGVESVPLEARCLPVRTSATSLLFSLPEASVSQLTLPEIEKKPSQEHSP